MAESGFMWIYLIFLLIPLSKILPRVIKKWKQKSGNVLQISDNHPHFTNNTVTEPQRGTIEVPPQKELEPKSLDMLVLGELHHGTKNFDILQKKLGIDNKTLDSVLEKLEKQGLMGVEQKQGLFGLKVELYPTEEGTKKYYS